MEDIKGMYKKVVRDNFHDTAKIDMGGQVLLYKRRCGIFMMQTKSVM